MHCIAETYSKKPLNVAIEGVLAPYSIGSRHAIDVDANNKSLTQR
jgi:hypothetical protein